MTELNRMPPHRTLCCLYAVSSDMEDTETHPAFFHFVVTKIPESSPPGGLEVLFFFSFPTYFLYKSVNTTITSSVFHFSIFQFFFFLLVRICSTCYLSYVELAHVHNPSQLLFIPFHFLPLPLSFDPFPILEANISLFLIIYLIFLFICTRCSCKRNCALFKFMRLISLNVMVAKCICFPTKDSTPCFCIRKHSIVHKHCVFFIHSSVDGQTGCLQDVATVSSAAINMIRHVSLHDDVFTSFGKILRSGSQNYNNRERQIYLLL